MDFGFDPRVRELREQLTTFMNEHVYPAEPVVDAQLADAGDPHAYPPALDELKKRAREQGLWNLFLPDARWGGGLSVAQYAPLAEITGRSPMLAPEALNCSAPDTGNMEVLTLFGTPEQQERWLQPLLDGKIRSCFAMTEPDVASSDATNIATSIRLDGDEWVINGRKWWISGAADRRCAVAIVMGRTDPDAPPHAQQSMVLVPLDSPGVAVRRALPVLGFQDREGHCEITFDDVRVPRDHLVGQRGGGFAIAQARLGPGRIHHCMRAIGMAERAFDLMCGRAQGRVAFGRPLAEQGVIRDWIATSRVEIDQARLLVLHAAWLIDTVGARSARTEIAAIKAVVPSMATAVIDRAIQVHGGGGLCDDFPLAGMYAHARVLRIADGPDEVHKETIARRELRRYAETSS